MATTTETKSIQLWPRGTSVRFSGEYLHYVVHEKDGAERPATEEENRDIQAPIHGFPWSGSFRVSLPDRGL